MPANLQNARFSGLRSALQPNVADKNVITLLDGEVQDDIEGEQETIPALSLEDKVNDAACDPDIISEWRATITGASKGVSDKTDSEYHRLIKQCSKFLIDMGLIQSHDEFFSATPPDEAPKYIIAWILSSCDEIDLSSGKIKPADQVRLTYTHAQKMRASMTYAFRRIHGLGNVPWQQGVRDGRMVGNPSISETVSTYMLSLRNRKVRAGETATSARAINPEVLEKLYECNLQPENHEIHDYQPGVRGQNPADKKWGGGMSRRALRAIYAIAFLCLLRADEVLKIRHEHVELHKNPERLVLTLPFRKTHQGGGIKPFVLYPMHENEQHLCPVRAYSQWIHASEISYGYLFRKMASGDRPSQNNTPMTSEQFLEMFRNNLLDVGVDPTPYGTHSFRRGGCQYFACDRRWTLRRICEWGGWSTEFSNLTIVKYLISQNDEPTESRDDFLNPNRKPTIKCPQCGRSCKCA